MTTVAGIPTDLASLDAQIADAENAGDAEFFRYLLAPAFAMRRASGEPVTIETFLAGLRPGGRRTVVGGSTRALFAGPMRVLVETTIEMPERSEPAHFHNVRLYVRLVKGGRWRLLAWANERVPAGQASRAPHVGSG